MTFPATESAAAPGRAVRENLLLPAGRTDLGQSRNMPPGQTLPRAVRTERPRGRRIAGGCPLTRRNKRQP